jgi:hypothetical protein
MDIAEDNDHQCLVKQFRALAERWKWTSILLRAARSRLPTAPSKIETLQMVAVVNFII